MCSINTGMSALNNLKNSIIGAIKDGSISGVTPDSGIASLGDKFSSRAKLTQSSDPQRAYMFSAYITGGVASYLGDIGVYVKSAEIPEQKVDVLTMHKRNKKMMYASRETSSNLIQMTFWDDEEATVDTYLRKWFGLLKSSKSQSNSQYGDAGIQSLKKDYTANIVIELNDSSDAIITKKLTLKNAFLVSIDKIDLSYEANEILSITATFAFDEREVN